MQYSVQTDYVDTDFLINQFGTRMNSDTSTMRLGLDATKDRWIVLGEVYYEYARGEGNADGIDSRTTGASIMPGYRVWTQEENGLDVAVFGIFDMGYKNGSANVAFATATTAPNQWRMSPGAGVAMGYASSVGLFQAAYTFNNSRNIDGDFEVTGESYMDIHSAACSYGMPLTEQLMSSVGLDYTTVEDTPQGLADEFTHVSVGLSTLGTKNWKVSGRYFESVDSSDTRGFSAAVAFMY
jgi:hypothetical protein